MDNELPRCIHQSTGHLKGEGTSQYQGVQYVCMFSVDTVCLHVLVGIAHLHVPVCTVSLHITYVCMYTKFACTVRG